MKKVIILMMAMTMTACMSFKNIAKDMPEQVINEIPSGASQIEIVNGKLATVNYKDAFKVLLDLNYQLMQENKDMGYLLASKYTIGDTQVQLNIVCRDSTIRITPNWAMGTYSLMIAGSHGVQSNWYHARWKKDNSKSTVAFIEAWKFAKKLNGSITFK